jgi:hypothetical protein
MADEGAGCGVIDLREAFESYNDEFLKFENIETPLHRRPDICAFLMLDAMLPGPSRDMVCSAEHDVIWLDIDCEKLAEVIKEYQILNLVRCGVRYSDGSLCMFV